jgi:hypothetical protein
MRVYTAESEYTLRARTLLKDWAGEGLISKEQYERLKPETVSELRTTNIFLRLVFFFFTVVVVGAAIGLFFVSFLSRGSEPTIGAFLLFFAACCYGAAEVAVSRFGFYRHGIEEALAVCSVACLCLGLLLAFGRYQPESLIPAAGAVLSLWIWHRFGLWYAFPAAMLFAGWLPGSWTSSRAAQHLLIAVLYAIGLTCVIALRSRHRFDYLNDTYSLAEALLWLGIYLAINLQLSVLTVRARYFIGDIRLPSEFPTWFYWTTWVLIWCLPPIVLARGFRQKDRFVMAVGGIVTILTFVTNKPYLGWPRHTWDPMLLGIVLVGVALFIRRWLARGQDGIRSGFTAARLSGKDKQWMNVSSAVLGLVTAQSITPGPQAKGGEFRFGGGASGGGGAGGDF